MYYLLLFLSAWRRWWGLTSRAGGVIVGDMMLEDFVDVSVLLGPGVYALVRRGVVIYVGKSKSVYQRVYAHRTTAQRAARGKPIPTWLPIKGFVFDQVFVRPCALADLDACEAEMIERYKPRFNESLKSALKITAPVSLRVGAFTIPLNKAPGGGEGLRRI